MKITKDYVFYVFEAFTKRRSTYTGSCQTNKKFSDVAQYIREFKFLGSSLLGQTNIDTDMNSIFHFKYLSNGKDTREDYYEIKITHYGEAIQSMQITVFGAGAAYKTKEAIAIMESKLKDFDGNDEVVEPAPAVDYSGNELPELLDIMDKKLQAFAANANTSTLDELVSVKDAIETKINAIPLAERGKFSSPMSQLNMFINTLKTQFANPMLDATQFVGTYVPQMQASLAEIAALVA